MSQKYLFDGNAAAVEAIKLAKVKVVSAYPITPQSPIAEKLSEYIANEVMDAKYIRVESEHSALSCAIGAQLTGVRAATATSSVGLALMHEVLGMASGCRVPIVMPVVNRSLASPWNLWCDHQDSMAERDSGWLQFYAEDAQEVLDWILIAYHLAELQSVLTPAMICMDGFFVSHCNQPVWVPSQAEVNGFLPDYQAHNLILDPQNPMFINPLISSAEFSEMRYQQKIGFDHAYQELPEVLEKFKVHFTRSYGLVEPYHCDEAQAVLVTLGSMSGTTRYVVDQLRRQGVPVGMLKISSFRPFPVKEIQSALNNIPVIGVLDRSAGLGAQGGPVWMETQAALKPQSTVVDYITGLGGRDITEKTIEAIFSELLEIANHKKSTPQKPWIDTREDALLIRASPEEN